MVCSRWNQPDALNRVVGNVLVGVLELEGSGKSFLIASKILEKTNLLREGLHVAFLDTKKLVFNL